MRFGSTLLSVKDMEKSIAFYSEVFGLSVEHDFGANVALSGGISLQTEESWKGIIGRDDISYGGNDAELYFEESDFDGFAKRLESMDGIDYVHPVIEHRWGQRAVRLRDPDGHIVEIGEDLKSVCRRFLDSGMTAVQASERMDVPLKYVRSCMARDVLESDGLLLRPWTAEDADALFEMASDPSIGPMAGWEPHESAEDSRKAIESILSRQGTFAIVPKDAGRPVGCISAILEDGTVGLSPGDVELGFWIGRMYWGRGYATKASSMVLDYAFEDLGCSRATCVCLESNTRCIRVQDRLGFLLKRTEDVFSTAFGTRSHRVSHLMRERWRLLRRSRGESG